MPACSSTVPGISATPYEDNLRYFNVVITGPEQSPYESKSLALSFCSHADTPATVVATYVEAVAMELMMGS